MMRQKEKTLEERLYLLGLVFLVSGVISIVIYFNVIIPEIKPCLLLTTLGLYCPGCGGTRAVEALFHGQLLTSLWYHPLVLYTVVIYGGFMLTNTMEHFHILHIKGWKFHSWHMYGALAIVMGNWIIKNILLICFQITL